MREPAAIEPGTATGGQAGDYATLAKPRLNLLVVATTLAGYYMAAPQGLGWALLLHTLVGTALVASGASAFNQLLEIEADGLMRRTRARPLPSGRIEPRRARAFALVLSILGLTQLAMGVNLLAAAVAFVLPAIPFVLLGLLLWAIFRRSPAVA